MEFSTTCLRRSIITSDLTIGKPQHVHRLNKVRIHAAILKLISRLWWFTATKSYHSCTRYIFCLLQSINPLLSQCSDHETQWKYQKWSFLHIIITFLFIKFSVKIKKNNLFCICGKLTLTDQKLSKIIFTACMQYSVAIFKLSFVFCFRKAKILTILKIFYTIFKKGFYFVLRSLRTKNYKDCFDLNFTWPIWLILFAFPERIRLETFPKRCCCYSAFCTCVFVTLVSTNR